MTDRQDEVKINISTYQWSIRFFSTIRRLLSVNIKMHHDRGQVAEGEIFLFNHFARFETFIPQYLIYQETGVYCRSIAAAEFFTGDDTLSNYLRNVGAVPHNHPRLIPYLAEEILRGHKVVIFPEGGMVKDRRVQDKRGGYSIYSRTALERRKHHTGAAVLSLAVDILKQSILHAFEQDNQPLINHWMDRLELATPQALLAAAERPSTIVPANITFYPMRVSDNLLHSVFELVNRGISRRLSEELLIEGNILLKNTDMDIHLGDILYTRKYWSWWVRPIVRQLAPQLKSLDELLTRQAPPGDFKRRLFSNRLRRNALRLRNDYMKAIYSQVTINLSHLAALIIYQLLEKGQQAIDRDLFHRMLYLAVKATQKLPRINLQRSLRDAASYGELMLGRCAGLDQFFRTAAQLELIEHEGDHYLFMPKLCKEHEFDEIRLENMVEVYANEARPVVGLNELIDDIINRAAATTPKELAAHLFDDERVAYRWDKASFSKPRHQELNSKETATRSAEPFLILPEQPNRLGIVLVHGFLASPSEVKQFADKLGHLGYAVIGPRLKGHGTSPWDLRERGWKEWLASVQRACHIMRQHCEDICLIGFSTGGALSLLQAAEQPDGLAGVVAISAPIKFRNKNMIFVPLVHHANRLVSWLRAYEGIMPFRPNDTEHPDINYTSMPVHALFELRLMVTQLVKRLPDVHCPALIIQGDEDPVVVPESANRVYEKISSKLKRLEFVHSQRHGILNENIDNTQGIIIQYLKALEENLTTPMQQAVLPAIEPPLPI
ncbi:alpha/beta fold hydrolase [Sedimenticola hydrogenitrophicus]|uniref:alpha/beta fold hydrolase n=1 Tax=Sedimenticola hydrogenitrophicus TaxID=2967975 RepID=UPI0021A4AC8D|nr:alpha/beta fold hydrolase [Sedimenticola hydrogenitrophicus]